MDPTSFLAVDGGNTKTEAVVLTADGAVLGRGLAGQSDISETDQETAFGALYAAVNQALNQADKSVTDLGGSAFRLAGCDWPEDEALLHRILVANPARLYGFTEAVR